MNNFKLNVVNSVVVVGLIAASMLMPLVAADLAQSQSAQPAAVKTVPADDLVG